MCLRPNIGSCAVVLVRLTQCWRSCRTAIEDPSHLTWWRCLRESNFLQLLNEASALIWVWQYWACSAPTYLLSSSGPRRVSAVGCTPPWHSSLSPARPLLTAASPWTLNLSHSLVTQVFLRLFLMKVLFADFDFFSCSCKPAEGNSQGLFYDWSASAASYALFLAS